MHSIVLGVLIRLCTPLHSSLVSYTACHCQQGAFLCRSPEERRTPNRTKPGVHVVGSSGGACAGAYLFLDAGGPTHLPINCADSLLRGCQPGCVCCQKSFLAAAITPTPCCQSTTRIACCMAVACLCLLSGLLGSDRYHTNTGCWRLRRECTGQALASKQLS